MKAFQLQPAMVTQVGVFYPIGYVFLMLPTEHDAREAADMLVRDGYDDESISLLAPQLIREQLARADGHSAVLTRAAAYEADTVRRFLQLAQLGHHALMVYAPTPHETHHIMSVLKDARISCGQKYRPTAIERLVS